MYKIDRGGRGVQKLFSKIDPENVPGVPVSDLNE